MTHTVYNCLLRRQYSSDLLRGGEDIQKIAWMLIFETKYAQLPGMMESRHKMILDAINRRLPKFTEEEANLDRHANKLLRRTPLGTHEQLV